MASNDPGFFSKMGAAAINAFEWVDGGLRVISDHLESIYNVVQGLGEGTSGELLSRSVMNSNALKSATQSAAGTLPKVKTLMTSLSTLVDTFTEAHGFGEIYSMLSRGESISLDTEVTYNGRTYPLSECLQKFSSDLEKIEQKLKSFEPFSYRLTLDQTDYLDNLRREVAYDKYIINTIGAHISE